MHTSEYLEIKFMIEKLEQKIEQLKRYLFTEFMLVLEIRCKTDIRSLEITKYDMKINEDVHFKLEDFKTIEDLMKAIKVCKGYSCYLKSMEHRNLPISRLPIYSFVHRWGVPSVDIVVKL